jgi:FkbM family methyltransferase
MKVSQGTNTFIYVILLLVLVVFFYRSTNILSTCYSSAPVFLDSILDTSKYTNTLLTREPKLADGCYHVFLDVGANIGVHNRFLFEPHLYPDSRTRRRLENKLGRQEGGYDNRDVCAFAFEPNPVHRARLESLSKAYQEMGWRLTTFHVGVSDSNGAMTFYHVDPNGEHNEWGFTAVPPNLKVKNLPSPPPQVVPTIRLAEFILQHVEGRTMPATVHGVYKKPKVLIKLDVEGMEFVILPDLVASGALCQTVDCIWYELHPGQMKFPNSTLFLHSKEGAMSFIKPVIQIVRNNPNCITRFLATDDESYLDDGMPFPTSNGTKV